MLTLSSKTQLIPLVTSCIPIYPVSSLLDGACGIGEWAGLLRTHLLQTAESYMVGLDLFRNNLRFAQKYVSYDDLVLADLRFLPFKTDSFQVCLAAEVIEHLKPEEGYSFLRDLERICFERVIVTTPNGSWPDHSIRYPNGEENIHEAHKSMWHTGDFNKTGYKVHSIGLRIKSSMQNSFIQKLIAGADFLLLPGWIFPPLGKHLVAYKDVFKKTL